MMNKTYSTLPLVITALALTITASSAFADKAKMNPKKDKMNTIVCEDFLMLDERVQPSVVYWNMGNTRDDIEEGVTVSPEDHMIPVTYVITECQLEKTAKVSDKVKSYYKSKK